MTASSQPLRVLCVDDNRDAADTLGQYLRLIGHDVVVCYDGPAALAAFAEVRPDACVLDIAMPGMNGYQLGRELRALAGRDPLLLVAVTALGRDGEVCRASAAAGFTGHLAKPADPGRVAALLGEYARRWHSRGRALVETPA